MKKTLKTRLIAWAVYSMVWVIVGFVFWPFVDFKQLLFSLGGFILFGGFWIMVFGIVPTRGASLSAEEFAGEDPPPNFDESTDAFDIALGLRQKDESEMTFDELIARKSDKKSN